MNEKDSPFVRLHGRRPVIAFFNGNMHYPNYRTLIRLVYDGLADEDINLHIYMGANPVEYVKKSILGTLCAENHFYSVFPYSAYDRPDLIIITMGGIFLGDREDMVPAFLELFSGTPILMLENAYQHPDVHNIVLENDNGMRELTEHLITQHGCRRLAHLSGPLYNNDSLQRLRAFKETLQSYGLEPVGIRNGTFTPYVDRQVKELLDARPDALLCANDVMATTAYQIARERGFRIGTDLMITGFDDTPFSAFMDPPLSTVRQDYGLIAAAVVEEVIRFVHGEELKNVVIPAQVILRKSCGCCTPPAEAAEAKEYQRHHDSQLDQMYLQTVESSLTLRNMLFQEQDEEAMFRLLGETLHLLGAKRSCILLHEQPLQVSHPQLRRVPEEIRMVMYQEQQEVTAFSLTAAPKVFHGKFRSLMTDSEPTRLTDFVLFYQELEYGVMVAEVDPDDLMFFYSLSLEIGSGLRFHQLSSERRNASKSLEEQNQILSYVASHDALTGLYNRAGIMNTIFSFVRSFPESDTFLLIMADLDHLKQINDCLGHSAGDIALRHASEVLHSVLPPDSPIGRNGGDEFLSVIHLSSPEEDPQLEQKLRISCDACTKREDLPFYLGVSIGTTRFNVSRLSSFLEVIEEADQELYQAKKRRRQDVIRK